MPLKKIRSSVKRAFLLFLMAFSLILLADTLIERPQVQKEILKRVSDAIGYDIEADHIELSIWNGIGISVKDISARSRRGGERFTASSIRLDLDIKSLLSGQIIPSQLYLSRPEIELPWDKDYDLGSGIKGFLPEKVPLLWFPGIRSLVIEQGHVTFSGTAFTLEDFDLGANRTGSSPLSFIAVSKGKIGIGEQKAGFEIKGTIVPPSNDDEHLSVDLKIKTGEIPLEWFNWPASIRVKDGLFKARLNVKGDPAEHLAVNGMVDLNGSVFELIRTKRERYKEFSIPEVTFDFESEIRRDNIYVRPVKIRSDDLEVDLGLLFDLKGEDGPLLDLFFTSGFMEVGTFKAFFPSQLIPAWLENRFFPMFTSGDIKVNGFSLKGGIDQIRHISRPENRSVMEMHYECRGIEVSGHGVGIPFRDVSADIALKDGQFSVTGLNARFGSSVIKDSGLNIRDVFSASQFYEFNIGGDFEIKELLGQKDMDVIPSGLSRIIDLWPDINGRITGNVSIGYQKGWVRPEILNGEFLVKGVSLDKEGFVFPVKIEEARVHIDDSISDYMLGSGSWGNSLFNMSANFGVDHMIPYLKDGLMSADVDMNQVFDALNLTGKVPVVFPETLPWDISLSGDGEEGWSVKGRFNLGDTSIRLKALSIGSSGVHDDNVVFELGLKTQSKGIDINSATLRLKDSSIDMTGTFDLLTKRFLKVNLRSGGLAMRDLSVVSDNREVFSGGVLKGELDMSMSGPDGNVPLVTGAVEGTGLSFRTGEDSPLISDCSFRADFSDGGAGLSSCELKVGESAFSVTGDIRGWSVIKGDIKVHSDYLNLSDILPSKSSPSREGITDRMDLEIDVDISGGRWNKFNCGQSEAELTMEKGNLYINDSLIRLDHGEMTLKGHVSKAPEREMLIYGDVHVKDHPSEQLIESLGIDYKGLKGNISFDGSLSVKGEGKKELLSSLSGSGKVSMTTGLIKNPNIMIKVLDFLSLQKIFEQRPPDLREEGLYFESISADAIIKNGVLESKNFIMRSPVLNAVAEGSADIPAGHIDCKLFAQPLGVIDGLVSKVPILGYIITGENKSVLAYPFEVKGSFTDPEVKYVPFETMEGGLTGLLKRIFLTPARIFDKMDKALNGGSGGATQ